MRSAAMAGAVAAMSGSIHFQTEVQPLMPSSWLTRIWR